MACVISPPLYWVGSALAEAGWLPVVKDFPFHRYFSRSVQISALLVLWPLVCALGVRRASDLGLGKNPAFLRDVLLGFGVALASVAALGAVLAAMGWLEWRSNPHPAGLLRICATAWTVSIVEEVVFRGVLLGLLLRSLGALPAILISSAMFAGVHFLKTSRQPLDGPVGWTSGFEQLPLVLSSAPEWPVWAWAAASLVLAGLILGFTAVRTRSLFLAIGIHAGWILGQQGLQWIGKSTIRPSDRLLPWIGPNVVSGAVPTGLLPLLAIAAAGFVIWLRLRPRHRER
jgi:membrane protease YdiL (CAAX protease family)